MIFHIFIIYQTSNSIILTLFCSKFSYLLHIVLHQLQLLGHKSFPTDNDVITFDNTFCQIMLFTIKSFNTFLLVWVNQNIQSIDSHKSWFNKISLFICHASFLTFCLIFIPIHLSFKSFDDNLIDELLIVIC